MEVCKPGSQVLPGLAPGGRIPLAQKHPKVGESLPIPGHLGLAGDSVACGTLQFLRKQHQSSRPSANKRLNME